MPSRVARLVFSAFILLILPACVSVDSRVWSEAIDGDATRRISGDFANRASYRSTGEFVARDNLAWLFGVAAQDADRVRVSGDPGVALTFTWYVGDEAKATRVFTRESGLAVADDGAIDLPGKGQWSGGDGAYGYQSLDVRIFINTHGDLATVQSSGGGGFIGPLPIGVYARHLAFFPRR